MNAKKIILGFTLSLTILSCTKEESGSTISSEDAKVSAQIDAMNDDVTGIVEEQESNTYSDAVLGKTGDLPVSELTNCATITRVPAFGTPPTAGQTVTKTIDFGSSCTLDNGNVVSGRIIITFIFDPGATSHTITYSFDNFTHNGIAFNGDKTFTRAMITTEANPTAHPQVTMVMDMTATLPGGRTYHRVGTRTREIVEGFGNQVLLDNIYKITGNWVTTGPNGGTQTSTITTPLRVKMSCLAAHKPLIVYGIIAIVRGDTTATLDFGNGDCDNLAVFTVNGNSYTIIIGN
jgi:hypothetical protein